jgi:hypothetical protein
MSIVKKVVYGVRTTSRLKLDVNDTRRLCVCVCSVDERREASTYYRSLALRKEARGSTLLLMFCLCRYITICRLYKPTLSDQAQVTLQPTVSLSDFVQRLLAGLSLLDGPRTFFQRGPNPLSATLRTYVCVCLCVIIFDERFGQSSCIFFKNSFQSKAPPLRVIKAFLKLNINISTRTIKKNVVG